MRVGKLSVQPVRGWLIAFICMLLGTRIIPLFDTYGETAPEEKAKNRTPYGLDRRIP